MTTTTDNSSETTAESKLFQVYNAVRPSFRMVTTEGRHIIFVEKQFITDDEDLISYLDNEIAKKHPWLSKGTPITSEDRDPMNVLRKKIIEEYKAEQAKMAMTDGQTLDAKQATQVVNAAKTGVTTSASLAALRTQSNAS